MDAFDADVLIYAAVPEHDLGRPVRALFPAGPVEGSGEVAGIGSVLLLPDESTAELATALGASYGLRAADAVHLATAVGAGADRFLTNNRTNFTKSITEIDITYPEDLPDPLAR